MIREEYILFSLVTSQDTCMEKGILRTTCSPEFIFKTKEGRFFNFTELYDPYTRGSALSKASKIISTLKEKHDSDVMCWMDVLREVKEGESFRTQYEYDYPDPVCFLYIVFPGSCEKEALFYFQNKIEEYYLKKIQADQARISYIKLAEEQ